MIRRLTSAALAAALAIPAPALLAVSVGSLAASVVIAVRPPLECPPPIVLHRFGGQP